jgi:hypothetical protein
MDWKQLLAYITGSVDQELLIRNEYLVIENRILRQRIPGRVRLNDGERKTLAEIGKKLGRQALEPIPIGYVSGILWEKVLCHRSLIHA